MSANRPAGRRVSFIGMHGPALPPRYCPDCGYDLLANLRGDQVRCPECGASSSRVPLLMAPPPHWTVLLLERIVIVLAVIAWAGLIASLLLFTALLLTM